MSDDNDCQGHSEMIRGCHMCELEKVQAKLAEERMQRTMFSSHEMYAVRAQAFEEAALEVEKHLKYPSIKLNGGDSDTDGRIVRPIAKAIRKLKTPGTP